MKRIASSKVWAVGLIVLGLLCSTSCSGTTQSTNGSAANANKPAVVREPVGGKIEVSSTPPGAAVMLIPKDEGGASPPQPRGTTPATITGLADGKYVVHLELPGYKFQQKEVEIKSAETVKLELKLRRE